MAARHSGAYRGARRNAIRGFGASLLKEQRKALGISRRQQDRIRHEAIRQRRSPK